MKAAYPIVMNRGTEFVVVFIPDFNINTQGKDYAEAMEMARDAIGLMGIDMEDDGDSIPAASPLKAVEAKDGAVVSLVDVDFGEYRRKNSTKTVRRNVSLPAWLDELAKEAEINVSAVLAKALRSELHVTDR